MKTSSSLKPMHLWESLLFFGIPAVALFFTTHFGINILRKHTGIPISLSWFINGGIVFVSLFLASIIGYKLEGKKASFSSFKKRFRLNPLNKKDWNWTIGAFILSTILMGIIFFIEKTLISDFTASPAFMEMGAIPKE